MDVDGSGRSLLGSSDGVVLGSAVLSASDGLALGVADGLAVFSSAAGSFFAAWSSSTALALAEAELDALGVGSAYAASGAPKLTDCDQEGNDEEQHPTARMSPITSKRHRGTLQ